MDQYLQQVRVEDPEAFQEFREALADYAPQIERLLAELVDSRVRQAMDCGVDGVVCSGLDVARVRSVGGAKMLIVVPGVRSAGAAAGDQKRVVTPQQALAAGADYLVVGREVTRAEQPRAALANLAV